MKRKKYQYQAGFLVLEALLAMTIAVAAIAGAVLMAFGGRALADDARQGFEALDLAQRLLAKQEILARDDFRLANGDEAQEGIFSGAVNVSRHSFFEKIARAEVEWSAAGRSQKIALETLIADYGQTAGNDTCDSFLTGDWKNPQIIKTIDFSDFAESASSTYAIGDIDVYKNKLYVAIEKTGTKTDSTFFIFDVDNPSFPTLLNKMDNAPTTINGFGSLAVNKNYAYFANNHNSDFSTCSQNYNCAQLQIINLDSSVISNFKLPEIFGKSGQGNSIFYKNGYIYLGLTKANGPEFNIIKVNDVNNPVVVGSFEIGAGINDIYVKGDYAYLATADSARELIILNIANPATPTLLADYNLLPDIAGWGYGKSVQVIGNKIYFGRTYIANSPEFYLLDHNQSSINVLGNYSENGDPFSVNGLIVRGNLAFVLAGSTSQGGSLRMLDIANPGNIVEKIIVNPSEGNNSNKNLPGAVGGIGGAAMDCEGNHLYVASIDGVGKSYVSIITAQ